MLLARARVEKPEYEVEADYGSFEVRRYAPRLVAEVSVRGNARQATDAGFRMLEDFISGNNRARKRSGKFERRGQKIAMTSPVERTASGDGWVISFTMPSSYTRRTLPVPNDGGVHIRELPARRYAVMRLSGVPSEVTVQRKIERLIELVDASGLDRAGAQPIYARYDPPWTPGLLRRNEILIELAM
jgi:hypothetical protein